MDIRNAYNHWAAQYDTNHNRTRDLEAHALRHTLANLPPARHCLEIGCGTGKNTVWLAEKSARVTAVDLSEEMLAMAGSKVPAAHVAFVQADITTSWSFTQNTDYDLIVFSLVLEHIEHLEPVFLQASQVLAPGGHLYTGELHPCKQYAGSQARFDTEAGRQLVTAYPHHLTDFIRAAQQAALQPPQVDEFFDDNDRTGIPRILTLLFRK